MLTFGRRSRPANRLWHPAADVYRSNDGWLVKVDLAGVCADELELELTGSVLVIRGCRRDTFYKEGFVYHQMEITYSRFEKTIKFPCELDHPSLEHHYSEGFLFINVRCGSRD